MDKAVTPGINRRQILGTALAGVAGSLLSAGLTGCLAAKPTGALDTSSWKTHCVGRFLIKLPASTQTKYTATVYGCDILWRRDLTPETARQEAEQKAEKYKAIKHEEIAGASQFIATFPLPGGGCFTTVPMYPMTVLNMAAGPWK